MFGLEYLQRGAAVIIVCTSLASAFGTTVIVDDSGKPLSEVRFDVMDLHDFQLPPLPDTVTTSVFTDSNGAVAALDLPSSNSLLVISKPRYGRRAFNVSTPLPERITLRPASELTGSVVDEKGSALPGVLIGPVSPGPDLDEPTGGFQQLPAAFPPLWTHTDERGIFRVPDLEPGTYSFVAQLKAKMPERVLARTEEPTSVTLSAGGVTISGILIGSRDHEPKPNTFLEAEAGPFRLYALTNQGGEFLLDHMPPLEVQFRSSPDRKSLLKTAQVGVSKLMDSGLQMVLLHDQGRTIIGKSVDAETSAPIAGLSLKIASGGGDSVTTRTRPDGSFMFSGVDQFQSYTISFDTSLFVHRSEDGNWRDDIVVDPGRGDVTTAVIPLMRRVPVSGTVLDYDGTSATKVVIQLRSVDQLEIGPDEFARPMMYQTATDEVGNFSVLVFPQGRYEVRARGRRTASELVYHEAYSTASAHLSLQLKPTAYVPGRLTDWENRPVGQAQVQLETVAVTTATGSVIYRRTDSTISDGEGLFSFSEVPTETVRLSAYHPAFDETATTEVELSAGLNDRITLEFPAGEPFSCVVTDGSSPVNGALVQLWFSQLEDQSSASRSLLRQTDETGLAVFRSLGTLVINQITVRHPNFAVFSAGPILLPQEEYRVRLRQHSSIEVTLKPPPDVSSESLKSTVWLLRSDAFDQSTEPDPIHFATMRQASAFQGKVLFKNVKPGWYRAGSVFGDLYSESDAVRLTTATEQVKLTISVGVTGTVEGRVTDEGRQAVADAKVLLKLQTRTPMELEPIQALSDRNGKFALSSVPVGRHVLTVSHSAYPHYERPIRVDSDRSTSVDVRLGSDSLTELTGVVTAADKGLPGAAVIIHKVARPDEWFGSAVTDASGKFRIPNVPLGTHTLVVEALAGEERHARRVSRAFSVSREQEPVHIALRALVQVRGHVRINDEEQENRRVLSLWFTPQNYTGEVHRASVAVDGAYSVFVEPGEYKVSLFDGPGPEFQVPEGADEIEADFQF